MSFGGSPSDVFAVLKFTARIISALKKDGGSQSKYQEAVHSLESLQVILEEFERLASAAPANATGDRLRSQLNHARAFIHSFEKKIEKYDEKLGEDCRTGLFRGSIRKIDFALRAAKDLQDFRSELILELEAIKFTIGKETIIGLVQVNQNVEICGGLLERSTLDARTYAIAHDSRLDDVRRDVNDKAADLQMRFDVGATGLLRALARLDLVVMNLLVRFGEMSTRIDRLLPADRSQSIRPTPPEADNVLGTETLEGSAIANDHEELSNDNSAVKSLFQRLISSTIFAIQEVFSDLWERPSAVLMICLHLYSVRKAINIGYAMNRDRFLLLPANEASQNQHQKMFHAFLRLQRTHYPPISQSNDSKCFVDAWRLSTKALCNSERKSQQFVRPTQGVNEPDRAASVPKSYPRTHRHTQSGRHYLNREHPIIDLEHCIKMRKRPYAGGYIIQVFRGQEKHPETHRFYAHECQDLSAFQIRFKRQREANAVHKRIQADIQKRIVTQNSSNWVGEFEEGNSGPMLLDSGTRFSAASTNSPASPAEAADMGHGTGSDTVTFIKKSDGAAAGTSDQAHTSTNQDDKIEDSALSSRDPLSATEDDDTTSLSTLSEDGESIFEAEPLSNSEPNPWRCFVEGCQSQFLRRVELNNHYNAVHNIILRIMIAPITEIEIRTCFDGFHSSSLADENEGRSLPTDAEAHPNMTKDPIAVDPENSEQKLDQMSRLNFGKIYAVEHNLKVMAVGMVAERSMHRLMRYFEEESEKSIQEINPEVRLDIRASRNQYFGD